MVKTESKIKNNIPGVSLTFYIIEYIYNSQIN